MKRIALFFACLLFIGGGIAAAQGSKVQGTVVSSEDGLPVIGASVFVTGTSIGAVTDANGNYVLTGVPASAKSITFSYIGMVTVEKPVASVVNVTMNPDSEALQEAVVTIAYGAAKKSSLTGAIASVSSEKLEMRPASSVVSALEGTVSGVQINSTYGAPGTDPSIRIRGVGTVNGSSDPLYVIDGVPFSGNISDINPADIESLSVLKDAASAALYGNRASNGVILITTKQAKQSDGKLFLNVDIKQGTYSRGIEEYARVNANQWMETEWINVRNNAISNGKTPEEAAAYANTGVISDVAGVNIFNVPANQLFQNGKLNPSASILPAYAEDLDWYGQTIKNGYRQEYNVNGGINTEKANAFFSAGYLNENGYVPNSDFSRFSGRASVNVKPTSWIKFGLNLAGTHQNTTNTMGDSSDGFTNYFMYCRQIAPIYPVHLHDITTGEYILDAAGNKQFDPGSYRDANGVVQTTRNQYPDRHVIWENQLNSDKFVRNTLNGTAYVDIYFLKDFTLTVKGDLNVRNNDENEYNSAVIGDGKGSLGRAKKITYRYKNYTLQQQLRWNHSFGDHNVDVLVGHENFYSNYNYMYAYKTGETFPDLGALSNFGTMTSLDGYDVNSRTESLLARVRYNYKDKYNLEGSFRRDGSSKLAPDTRWGNFWSIGANWVISKENFMKDVDWVSFLKLRADYGEVGNDAGAGTFGYMALYTGDLNNNIGAYWLGQNANNELKWETGQSWGIGLESRLFDRWNINVEYFDKRNKDLLFDVYQPLSAGATASGSAESTVTQNLGTISNRGWEIETDVDIVKTRNWHVNFGANVTLMKNKIVSLPEQNRKNGIIDGTKKIVEGGDRYQYFLYTFEGVDQMTGRSLYKLDDEKYYITDNNEEGGNVIFGSKTDADGKANTIMDAANYVIINGQAYSYKTTYAKREFHGTALPTAFGSFNLSAGWKGLSLNALFTYSFGGYVYDGVYASLMSVTGTPSSIHADILNSWDGVPAGMTETSANRIKADGIPEINYTNSSDNNAGTTSRWLVSSNYLVLKNLSLSYKLPQNWVKAMQLKGITVSLTCENLFTLTARQGLNPQQSFAGTQSNYLVTPRVFSGAVSFKF